MRSLEERGADYRIVFLNHMLLIQRFWNQSSRIGRQRLSSSTLVTSNWRRNVIASGNTNGMRLRICLCRLRSLIIHIYTMLWSTHVNMLVLRWLKDPRMTCSIFSGRATLCRMILRTLISTRNLITFLDRRSSAAKTYSGVIWIVWGSSSPKSFLLHLWAMFCKKSTGSFKQTVLILKMKRHFTS